MPHGGGHSDGGGGGHGGGGGAHLSALAPAPSHSDMHATFSSMHTRDGFHNKNRHQHDRFFRNIFPTYYNTYAYPKCVDWSFVGVYPKDNLPPDVASYAGSITYPTASWINNVLWWFEQTPEGVSVYRCMASTGGGPPVALAAPQPSGSGDHFVAPFIAGDYYFPGGCTWIKVGSYPQDKGSLPLKVGAYAAGGGQGNAWIDNTLYNFKKDNHIVNVYQCTSYTGGYPVAIAAPPNKGIGATAPDPTPSLVTPGLLMLGALGFLVGGTLTYVYVENTKRR
jgi:hypothetical protein